MSYDTTVEGYLKRCKQRRDAGSLQDLLYAALELRLGVEMRLAESVQAVDGLTVARRRQWKVVHLANMLQTVKWSNGDDVLVMLYHLKDPDETFELHYFPVTKRLTETVGRLGDFLHRNERLVSDQAAVHRELTTLVKEGYGDLLMASSGELLGLPQLDPKTGSLNVILKFPDGDPRAAALQDAFKSGRQYRIDWVTITPVGQPTFYDAEPAAAASDSEGA
ncbi:hypothetical protein FFI97_004290 [Variovorax sp. KBS0712]|uniref:hypothetical protein n=1 Tax=Variovorax sp. KBS0712 TaxID=2578111 RepID=UPI0011184A57|nr:hypothetical protein [Variovorax sp. KBS0712]TSD59550.1 hypothetical protein FFI97_004290 [Variovorax sp. KBS0712]